MSSSFDFSSHRIDEAEFFFWGGEGDGVGRSWEEDGKNMGRGWRHPLFFWDRVCRELVENQPPLTVPHLVSPTRFFFFSFLFLTFFLTPRCGEETTHIHIHIHIYTNKAVSFGDGVVVSSYEPSTLDILLCCVGNACPSVFAIVATVVVFFFSVTCNRIVFYEYGV